MPVERFMQEYFRHSMAIAEIAQRFVARHRRRPIGAQFVRFVMTHYVDGVYRVGLDQIDVSQRHRATVCSSLERILALYLTAVMNGVGLSPKLVDQVKQSTRELTGELTSEAIHLFLRILKQSSYLGATLRSMYETGVLELVVPAMKHTRCLLQFNQYHSYTVDEHTLRAVEAAEQFEADVGPLGTAYHAIRHKELLHLAILLHDAGKGYDEDHSEVGRRIAEETATRLQLPEHQRDLLVFLVHRHLIMAHLAFRRDIADPEILLRFNHEVGSPESLRMLYVLTAADLTAVGPGVWNDWKNQLLTALFERAMVSLSGKHYLFQEPSRLQQLKDEVVRFIAPKAGTDDNAPTEEWIQQRLDAFPPHYLIANSPERIARDLDRIRQQRHGEIDVEGRYEADTDTVEYRVITREDVASGCFHKITGVLTAKRMEILSAQISTSQDRVIVDSYHVLDHDYTGEVPAFRIEEVSQAIRRVLAGEITVEDLMRSHRRYNLDGLDGPVSNLPMRVVIDNDSSERCTILDVFAHDRPGLLYTIAKTIVDLDLSVMLAKISTHFDQIVDVFYITGADGEKIRDGRRLVDIRQQLSANIAEFERQATERVEG